MKERGIIFSAPMVRALLEGRKSMTRRIVKPQPEWRENVSIPGHYATFGKGGSMEADPLPMSQDLYDLMMRRWKARKQDEWVFWSEAYKNHFTRNKNTMKGVCKRAKVPLYGFHSLRHFMASYHADELKTSLTAISKLLRHKSRRTTELYLHTIDESVREAVDKQANLSKAQAEDAIRSEKAND